MQEYRGQERQRAARWSPRCAEMGGAMSSLTHLLSQVRPSVPPIVGNLFSHLRRTASAAAELAPEDWDGAGREARLRPPNAPPLGAAPPRPRPHRKDRRGAGPRGWAQPMAVRATYKVANGSRAPPGRRRDLRRGQTAPGNSSGIEKGAGCGGAGLALGHSTKIGEEGGTESKTENWGLGGEKGRREPERKTDRPCGFGQAPPSGTQLAHLG